MSRKYAIFITALFCAFLGVFMAANAVSPDQAFSQMENRTLQQRPQLEAKDFALAWPLEKSGDFFSGKFMSEFETYVNDQFVLRDSWIAMKSAAERAIGKQENNGVYFCKQDTLIPRFTAPEQEKVDKNFQYVADFAQKAGVPVAFSLVPGKVSVWADRLPDNAPNGDENAFITQGSRVPGVTWADIAGAINAHAGEDIYYRTDHHWTSLGAYYGYAALGDALGYTPVPLSDYTKTTVSTEFYGTTFSSSGVRWVKPDAIDTYVPDDGSVTVTEFTYDRTGSLVEVPRALYVRHFLDVKDKYAMFLGGQQSLGVVKTPNADKPKLLIVRDSYTDSLVPFLTPHFSEIHLIDLRYYKFSAAEYIQQHGIDQVLVLYSVDNFVKDSNLVWLSR